jgi:hypothetical protein
VVFYGIPDAMGHISMMRRPGDLLLWGHQRADLSSSYGLFANGASHGNLIVAHLEPGELAHLNNWLVKPPYSDSVGNCMEWLSNAEVGPGKPIFHTLGLTRSRDGHNIQKKLIRAGNDKVGVIGVKVGSVDEFNAMTDDQLLGPLPAGGLEDSVR